MKITVGVMGATGYMGGEVTRVLLEHPLVELRWATSRHRGQIGTYHPNLFGVPLELIPPDEISPCDVVFLALPTEISMQMASLLLQQNCHVIDLGAAFRLKERKTWERVYDATHTCWELVEQSVYGLSELHQAELTSARLIANPGCFASAAILAMAPLVHSDLVDEQKIVVQGLSGTAGMGAQLCHAAHHPEIGNNAVAYNVVDHRHSYEIEQELSQIVGKSVTVHFTPVYIPITRGILAVCTSFAKPGSDLTMCRDDLIDLYQTFYNDEEFIQVYDVPYQAHASWQYKPYPLISSVTGTNFCYIGVDVDKKRNRIVTFAVLDSLGKGGAHVGVENMNRMMNLPPSLGLHRRGLHPI